MEEFVHHVDPEDRVVGRVSRDQAHELGLLHRAGCVVIHNSAGSVLLAKRAQSKAIFAGCWDWACSFHVAWGERYEEAASRELLEETGLTAAMETVGTILIDEGPDRLIVRVFSLAHEGPIELDPEESEWAAFKTPVEVEALLATEAATSWLAPAWALVKP